MVERRRKFPPPPKETDCWAVGAGVTRYLQAAESTYSPPAGDDLKEALLHGSGPRARAIAEILAGQGWRVELAAAADGLAETDGEASLVVFAERTLVAAGRDLKALAGGLAQPPAIAVCDSIRPGEVRVALAAGIAGVVLAGALGESLLATVSAVLTGQVAVPRFEARQVEAASLSTREKQILGMVVMGCMNGDIAERLVVAESTVKSHLSSAFGKLGVRSRNEAVDLLLDSQLGLGKGILGLGGEPLELAAKDSGERVGQE
jgi:DNA-binding NarL/FixJ family response regulator